MIKNTFHRILLIGLGLWSQPFFSQEFNCNLVVPPFQIGTLFVDHVFGNNVDYYINPPIQEVCVGSGFTVYPPNIHLGKSIDLSGTQWYPFTYEVSFSQPITYFEFILINGTTVYPEIDYGAENFVFEAPNCQIILDNLFSCATLIEGDTIYLGVGNGGHGWFSISFNEPVFELTISGKGGGNGSGFQICSNSIQVAPLWAGICAASAPCSQEAITFTAYGSAPPYSFTYLLNGAQYTVQTTGTNETIEISVPMANGIYEYELISITDGNGEIANISCNNRHTVVVNNEPEFVIPNVFTPNNDGVNDWFGLTSNAEVNGQLLILNRWGNVVYERSFVTIPGTFIELWDGTSASSVPTPNSGPAPDGVYFYKLILKGEDWEEEFVRSVTLRR